MSEERIRRRERTGLGLAEAKDAIDAWQERYKLR